jgi:hypothetical protein
MVCYLIFAIILGGFGGICYISGTKNHDVLLRYDDHCGSTIPSICKLSFVLEQDLVNPKIYYKLENFYANHRNFVKSRSYKQLRGTVLTKD